MAYCCIRNTCAAVLYRERGLQFDAVKVDGALKEKTCEEHISIRRAAEKVCCCVILFRSRGRILFSLNLSIIIEYFIFHTQWKGLHLITCFIISFILMCVYWFPKSATVWGKYFHGHEKCTNRFLKDRWRHWSWYRLYLGKKKKGGGGGKYFAYIACIYMHSTQPGITRSYIYATTSTTTRPIPWYILYITGSKPRKKNIT